LVRLGITLSVRESIEERIPAEARDEDQVD
jgi:hypothetical protein